MVPQLCAVCIRLRVGYAQFTRWAKKYDANFCPYLCHIL